MASVVTLTAADWARSRFVRSRLFEAEQAVRGLLWPEGRLHHRAWLETVDGPAALARVPVLAALNPRRGMTPDFLVPPARPDVGDADAELAQVAATDLAVVVAQVRESLASHDTAARRAVLAPLLADPAELRARAAAEMRWAWEELLAPFWGQVSRLVDADLAYRARVMSRSGIGRAVEGLHPDVVRDGDRVVVGNGPTETHAVGSEGFALMPSAFCWPQVALVFEAPWPVTIVYPARGIAELWAAPPRPSGALVAVVGRTRALLLTDLGEPATTTALAARHDLSLAAVSTQLGRLAGAGLVSAQRQGREVRYRRTSAAEALLAASR